MPRNDKKIEPKMLAVGKNLARIRRERGITQVELAATLQIPQSMVSEYERGILRLHGQLLIQLTQILGVSADQLLGIETRADDRFQTQRRFLRKLHEVDKLSKRDQAALLRTIEAFLDGRLRKSA